MRWGRRTGHVYIASADDTGLGRRWLIHGKYSIDFRHGQACRDMKRGRKSVEGLVATLALALSLVWGTRSAMSPRNRKGQGRAMRILVMLVLVSSGIARVVVVVVRYGIHRRR
jgi:hypothetical protein